MEFEKIIRYNSLPALADIVVDLTYLEYANYNALPLWKASIRPNQLPLASLAPYTKIFIKSDFLGECINFLSSLTFPAHLITGVSDVNPLSFKGVEKIINNRNILSWVGNNLPKVDSKILPIPIGFTEKSRGADEFEFCEITKKNSAVLTPHGNTSQMRAEIDGYSTKQLFNTYVVNERLSKKEYLELLYRYKFSICLPGNGLDTHRVYESISMGSIPIVMRSPISDMQKSFGAIVIDQLDELNPEFFLKNYEAKPLKVENIYFSLLARKIANFQQGHEKI